MLIGPHVMGYADICERCGATSQAIVEGTASAVCTAPDNMVSLTARAMKRDMDRRIRPILEKMGLSCS